MTRHIFTQICIRRHLSRAESHRYFNKLKVGINWTISCIEPNIMTTRHITLSRQQGMITELELMGSGFAAGEQYMLRYRTRGSESTNGFDFGSPDFRSVLWRGFRYRDDQISVLLERQGQWSAEG